MPRLDPIITACYLLLALVSLLVIFSVSPDRLLIQGLWILVGFGLYLYLSTQDGSVFLALAKFTYPLAILLLVATFVFGESVRGSVRWINLGEFRLQTSELAKPLLILSFARLLAAHPPVRPAHLLLPTLALALPLGLILRQPDLGTALVLGIIFVAQLFLAGLPRYLLAVGFGLFLTLVLLAPNLLAPYQLARLESFLEPGGDPLGAGYNVIQSQIAIGSGGLFGKGLGDGTQTHLRFLPEFHTDFIFASLVEELGLIGGVFVILLLTVLLFRLSSLLLFLPREPKLVIVGVLSYLLFQTLVNIGMNLGIIPVTGVTLPLVSYGGSSILAISLSLGIASSLAHTFPRQDSPLEIR